MLCMICNTNNNTVKCTQPNKHGFAYVIHYDEVGNAPHKHYRFISNDEIIDLIPSHKTDKSVEVNEPPSINNETQNGSFEPNMNESHEKNGSFEPIFDSFNSGSDNVSDSMDSFSEKVPQVPRSRKRNAIPIEDNVL